VVSPAAAPLPRGRRARRAEAERRADEAGVGAAAASFALEQAEQEAVIAVELAALDTGPLAADARPLPAELAELRAWVATTLARYRAVSADRPLTDDADPELLVRTAVALAENQRVMEQGVEALHALAARASVHAGRVEERAGALRRTVAGARDALLAALAARDASAAAGLSSSAVDAALVHAADALEEAEAGVGALAQHHHVEKVAARVHAGAAESRRLLAELAELPAQVPRRQLAAQTRAEVLAARQAEVAGVLRRMRASYGEGALSGVVDAHERAGELLERARLALARSRAASSASPPAWSEAQAEVEEMRQLMHRADDVLGAPAERLAALDALAADPAPRLREARAAVRGAQRLATAAPSTDPRMVAHLDRLGLRMDAAEDAARAQPPDWWTALRLSRSVQADAARAVLDIRALLADPSTAGGAAHGA